MTIEQANIILNKYGIAIDDPKQLQLLIKITHLPTSDIEKLFNDLTVEQVFEDKRKELLF